MGSINNLGDLAYLGPSDSSFPTSIKHVPPLPPLEDQVQIATIPSVGQVEQLQNSSTSSLPELLGNAIPDLRSAAHHSTDPVEAAYLSGLADRFQSLEESGGIAPDQASALTASSGAT
jgi:hypothetical protein